MKQAAQITIRRCTLRVTRRGGWSWGADARSLVNRAMERLPALLERRLVAFAERLPDHTEISAPVQLRVSLRRQQWEALMNGAEPGADLSARIESELEAAVSRALPLDLRLAAVNEQGSGVAVNAHTPGAADKPIPAPTVPHPRASALWSLLAQWRAAGSLVTQLAALDEGVLRMWLERLIGIEVPGRARVPDETTLPALWREVCAMPILLPAGTARQLVRHIVLMVELRTRWDVSSAQAGELLARFREEASGTAASARSVSGDASDASAGVVPDATPSAVATVLGGATRGTSSADQSFEADIPCALPFLLLTPLSRCGYLGVLAATFEAAHATALAGGAAMGLAHKCLAVPQRGWLRDAGALAAAATFAARQDCDVELIANAGRALRAQLPVLDGHVTGELIHGHRVAAGWLIGRDSTGALIAFDEDGLAPVAMGSFQALAARIAPSGGVVFLPSVLACTEYLETLDELQIPYASDGNLAARASAASFVAPDGARLWTSSHGTQQGRARALAERGVTLMDEALASWEALHTERPAQRPGIDPAFERSLSLAAGFGLSAIAWTLWRQRARATAFAAIERFADLDAHVRITSDRVHVILPMGKRAWDLRDHGLLVDVRDVPWLDARTVTFGVA